MAATEWRGMERTEVQVMDWLEEGVVRGVNAARQRHDRGPLQRHPRLDAAARGHAADMATYHYFSHMGRKGEGIGTRLQAAGYLTPHIGYRIAENIFWGARTAEEAVRVWLESPGHRANILTPGFNETGVGVVAAGTGDLYWVQVFGVRYGG